MTRPDANKWVLLRVRRNNLIDYTDGNGRVLTGDSLINVRYDVQGYLPYIASRELPEAFQQVLQADPLRRDTLRGPRNIPVPVFIELEPDVDAKTFELFSGITFQDDLMYALFGITRYRFFVEDPTYQVVFKTISKTQSNFQLPYNIVFDKLITGQFQEIVRGLSWYRGDAEEGIKLKERFEIDPDLDTDTDIYITSLPWQFYELSENRLLPKLVVLLANSEVLDYGRLTELGSSVLIIPGDLHLPYRIEQFFNDFFESVIHDFPLHEAFHFARGRNDFREAGCLLFTSPENNHSLRVSDGLQSFKDEIEKYASQINPGNSTSIIDLMSPENGERLSAPSKENSHLPDYFNMIKGMGTQFNRESSGFIPLVNEIKIFRNEVQPQLNELHSRYLALANDPVFFNDFVEKQQRVVDVTMETLNESLLYVPTHKSVPLAPGRSYRLNIQIGQRAYDSLVVGQVDPIDPLLPDPEGKEGHLLDIVVFPKDFSLSSPGLQSVRLPLAGASEIARFIIVPPSEKETAYLRIAVFKGNHLLQGFELKAILKPSPAGPEEFPVQVTMDISSSEKFNNLDHIAPRDLFIGLNRSGETHSLFIKDDQAVKEVVGLNEALIEDAQLHFSSLLKEISFDDGIPKFRVPTANAPNKAAFEDAIRQFARMSADLYDSIFTRADDPLSEALERIASGADMAIQIGRYDLNYSFPWPLLYDLPLELPKAGRPEFPVCNGQRLDPEDHPHARCAEGAGCKHNPGLQTYCTDGFWGTRHRVEQLLRSDAPADTVQQLASGAASRISFAVNMEDTHCTTLAEKLEKEYLATRTTHDNDDLVQSLWDVSKRPGTLVVFGHTKTKPQDGEPPETRILTFPAKTWPDPTKDIPDDKWIFDRLILNKIKRQKRWTDDPLPLVMLISCDNATLNMSSLNSIVAQFYNARAAAVIGTECDITTDLGACFVDTVLKGLYQEGRQLGEILQSFNRYLFENYNPLPFVFTCYGNYNLQTKTNAHEKAPVITGDLTAADQS